MNMEQSHYGYTIRVNEGQAGAVCRVLRDGEAVYKAEGKNVGEAFEAGWRWACTNRPVSIRVASNLIEHHVEYEGWTGTRSKVFTSTNKAIAEEAALVLGEMLRQQWADELAEHDRRRDDLAAYMEAIAAQIAEVEAEMEPLKERRGRLKTQLADAPGLVYRPTVEKQAIDELAPTMARRQAGGRFVAGPAGGATTVVVIKRGPPEEEPVVTDEMQVEAGVAMDEAANGPKKKAPKRAPARTQKK